MNMTYKDTTFCTRNCANNGCHRNTKRDDFQPKENDWVAYCSFSKCEQFKEPQPEYTEDVFCEACGKRISYGTFCSGCDPNSEWNRR